MSDHLDLPAITNLAGRIRARHCEPGGDVEAYDLARAAQDLLAAIVKLRSAALVCAVPATQPTLVGASPAAWRVAGPRCPAATAHPGRKAGSRPGLAPRGDRPSECRNLHRPGRPAFSDPGPSAPSEEQENNAVNANAISPGELLLWQQADGLDQLGNYAALVFEGRMRQHPCHRDVVGLGPGELETLIRLNRAGFVTTAACVAPPGTSGYLPSAAVEGFCTEQTMRWLGGHLDGSSVRLLGHSGSAGLITSQATGWLVAGQRYGDHYCLAEVDKMWSEVCNPTMLAQLHDAWQVAVIDFSGTGLMWRALGRAVRGG